MDTVLINCHYPVTPERFVLQWGVIVKKLPGLSPEQADKVAGKFAKFVGLGFQQDVDIWTHKAGSTTRCCARTTARCTSCAGGTSSSTWTWRHPADMVARHEFEIDTTARSRRGRPRSPRTSRPGKRESARHDGCCPGEWLGGTGRRCGHACRRSWSWTKLQAGDEMKDIAFTASGEFIVGLSGQIWARSGDSGSWTQQTPPGFSGVPAIWADSDGKLYAVSQTDGNVISSSGNGAWSVAASLGVFNLWGIWGERPRRHLCRGRRRRRHSFCAVGCSEPPSW